MGPSRQVKTTLEIPDATFRKAKSEAATKGISFREFVTEALREKLRRKAAPSTHEPEWMRLAGAFAKTKAQRQETRRIQETIDREFDQIDPEENA